MLEMYLDYDSDSGVLTRRLSTNPRGKAGDPIRVLNDEGYIVCCIGKIKLRAHRVAWCWMTGSWPERDLDHINGDRTDNRFANLREATRSQNLMNTGVKRSNKSGVVGVHFCSERMKWVAQIKIGRRTTCLGRFDQFADAVAARKEAEKSYYGEFAPADRHLAHGA